MTMTSIATVDTSTIRYCPFTTEHPFDTDFAPARPDSDWVRLLDTEDDEYALLLCADTPQTWVAWLPSQGEVILHQDQLCRQPFVR